MTSKNLNEVPIKKMFEDYNVFKRLDINNNLRWDFNKKEFGDYQTPSKLIEKVIKVLDINKVRISNILEPTSGQGNFIIEILKYNSDIKTIVAIEKQEEYFSDFINSMINNDLLDHYRKIKLINEDIFKIDLDSYYKENLLIIGNPPWVTNSGQSTLNSKNLPEKSNFRMLKGMDAITGKSNFDIAEAIIIKLIEFLNSNKGGTIALLVKNIVIRNILNASKDLDWSIADFKMYTFDAKKEFNVNTSASLLFLTIDKEAKSKKLQCEILDIEEPTKVLDKFGWVGDNFVSSVDDYNEGKIVEKNLLSSSKIIWRSGIKHDASKVMELEYLGSNQYYNKFRKISFKNEDLIYPYLKSSDIGKIKRDFKVRKGVIVTQKFVSESTDYLEQDHPNIWRYLEQNSDVLNNRKSSIYRNKPMYSIFGIGSYAFKDYKIAISGMYKKSKFSFIPPVDQKPVMFDDTVYYIGFDQKEFALISLALLNSTEVQSFIRSIAFIDNKRPYTKDILMRIDLEKALELISIERLNDYLEKENLSKIDCSDVSSFKNHLSLLD